MKRLAVLAAALLLVGCATFGPVAGGPASPFATMEDLQPYIVGGGYLQCGSVQVGGGSLLFGKDGAEKKPYELYLWSHAPQRFALVEAWPGDDTWIWLGSLSEDGRLVVAQAITYGEFVAQGKTKICDLVERETHVLREFDFDEHGNGGSLA